MLRCGQGRLPSCQPKCPFVPVSFKYVSMERVSWQQLSTCLVRMAICTYWTPEILLQKLVRSVRNNVRIASLICFCCGQCRACDVIVVHIQMPEHHLAPGICCPQQEGEHLAHRAGYREISCQQLLRWHSFCMGREAASETGGLCCSPVCVPGCLLRS